MLSNISTKFMLCNWKFEMESKSALEIAKYTLPMELFKFNVGGGNLFFPVEKN